MKPSKDISRLIEIMAALRAPKTGCPWDIEQDFSTIAPYTIEEAYEVADAIARGDLDDLRDELGDLLLQVVYHAQMAEEAGEFAFGDVVQAITTKMIRRHPHVFGDEKARSAGMAKGMWEKIKAEEKAEKRQRPPRPRARPRGPWQGFSGQRAGRPARADPGAEASGEGRPRRLRLERGSTRSSTRSRKRSANCARRWPRATPRRSRTSSATCCLPSSISAVTSSSIPKRRSAAPTRKFRSRFHYVEQALEASGNTLEKATLDEMEALWQQAKKREVNSPYPLFLRCNRLSISCAGALRGLERDGHAAVLIVGCAKRRRHCGRASRRGRAAPARASPSAFPVRPTSASR